MRNSLFKKTIFLVLNLCLSTVITKGISDNDQTHFTPRLGISRIYSITDYSKNTTHLSIQDVLSESKDTNGDTLIEIGIRDSLISKETKIRPLPYTKKVILKKDHSIIYLKGQVVSTMKAIIQSKMAGKNDEASPKAEDFQLEENGIIIPSDLKIGMKLDDYNLRFKLSFITLKIAITERKVIGKEKISTEVGDFDCYIIESFFSSKAMMISEKVYSKEWYARGVGLIKSEVYSKNKSELVSSTELISSSKILGDF